MSDDEYVPLPPQVLEAMPDAQVVKRRLLDAIDTEYNVMVKARGDVTSREQVFPGVRKVASWHEQAKDLKAAFEAARKRTAELLEDEVVAAVGEQDGVPNERSFTVPDAAGDVVVSVKTSNVYHIDTDTLVAAATAVHLNLSSIGDGRTFVEQVTDVVNGDDPHVPPENLEGLMADLVMGVVNGVLACGKFDPQVTKVRAYADEVARNGDDALSGVVRDSIRKTVQSDGVTMKRKAK